MGQAKAGVRAPREPPEPPGKLGSVGVRVCLPSPAPRLEGASLCRLKGSSLREHGAAWSRTPICHSVSAGWLAFVVDSLVKKPKKSSKDFFCKAEMLADEHLIIRLETIYKAEDKFRLLKVPMHRAKKLGQFVCTVQREETKVCNMQETLG